MKKIFALLLSVTLITGSVFVLASCGGKKKAAIVGDWKDTYFTYTFNEDGTGQYDIAGNAMKFTYTTEGEKLIITYEGVEKPEEKIYSIDGDKLIIKATYGSDLVYTRVK